MTHASIGFRTEQASDHEFLFDLYTSARSDVAAADMDEASKFAFLQMQFSAQSRYYRDTFPNASYQIILHEESPAGRLYIDRPGDEIHIIDIALLPEYRQRGIGTRLMRDILSEATTLNLPVRIYVEIYNTALAWYKKLGFVQVDDINTHLEMKWKKGNTGK